MLALRRDFSLSGCRADCREDQRLQRRRGRLARSGFAARCIVRQSPDQSSLMLWANPSQLNAEGDDKVKLTTRFALFALASTLFAGCSAATSSSPQPPLAPASTGAGAQAADAARAAPAALSAAQPSNADEVFVSDQNANEVKIFGRDGKLLGAIPGFTTLFGLGADASGNLYVPNWSGLNTLVFASDHKTLIATLLDPGHHPYAVAVHSVSGLVAVASQTQEQDSIEFYLKGKTTPCRHLPAPGWGFIAGLGFDALGNLYLAGNDNNIKALIGAVPGPGCAATGITNIAFTNPDSFFSPTDVKVTPSGNIAVLDGRGVPGPSIYTYAPPVNGSLGAPIATTALNTITGAQNFALSHDGALAYVTDPDAHDVKVFSYPSGAAAQTIGFDLSTWGVVVTPIWR